MHHTLIGQLVANLRANLTQSNGIAVQWQHNAFDGRHRRWKGQENALLVVGSLTEAVLEQSRQNAADAERRFDDVGRGIWCDVRIGGGSIVLAEIVCRSIGAADAFNPTLKRMNT